MQQPESYPYWHMTRVMPSVIMGFCCMVGIPGNVVVLIVVGRKFESGNYNMRLMLNLALCDLMVVLCLPLVINNLLRAWDLGPAACKLLFFLIYCSLNGSVLTIMIPAECAALRPGAVPPQLGTARPYGVRGTPPVPVGTGRVHCLSCLLCP